MKTGKFRSSVAQSPKTEYAWIASAALILTLVISLFAVVPRVAALEGVSEQPFPEVGVPIVESIATAAGQGMRYTDVSEFYVERLRAARDAALLAPEGVAEQPFPEVEGPIVESIVTGMGPGMRYTNVSEFYVEKLRAARDSARLALEGVAEQPFPEVEGPIVESVASGTGMRYTDVSEFYVERLRAAIIRSQAGLSR